MFAARARYKPTRGAAYSLRKRSYNPALFEAGTSTNIEIGETTTLTVNDTNANKIGSQLATLGQSAIIQTISYFVVTAAGNIRLAIYDATGAAGGPGALKAETASTVAVGPNTWNVLPVVTPVLLSPGNYWLAWQNSSASLVQRATFSGGSNADDNTFAYAPFPATFTIDATGSNRFAESAQLTPGAVTGASAIAEASDTTAATAAVAVSGPGAVTDASDTIAGAGQVSITGAGTITQAPDVIAGSGAMQVVGSAPITESPDVASGAAVLAIAAAASIQEAADILISTTNVAIAATSSIAESPDTAEGAGSTIGGILGQGDINEASDALSAAGQVAIAAAAVIQEAADAIAGTGQVGATGIASLLEAADGLSSAGKAAVSGAAALNNAADTAQGSGTVVAQAPGTGSAAITDLPDVLTAISNAAIAAAGMITESADILQAFGSNQPVITGSGSLSEAGDVLGDFAQEAPDTATGAGKVSVLGTGAVVQGADTAIGTGTASSVVGAITDSPDVAAGAGKVDVKGTATILQFPDLISATGTAPQQILLQSDQLHVSGASGATLAFPFNLTAGSLIVVSQVHFTSSGVTVIGTPTDTLHTPASRLYQPLVPEQRETLLALRSYYIENCLGGPCTVNFDIVGPATGEITVFVSEWNGRALVNSISVTSVVSGPTNTNAPSSGNITPIDNDCLLIALMNPSTNHGTIAITPESGWTTAQEYELNAVPLSMTYKVQVGAPVAEDADWSIPTAQLCLAHVAAFKKLAVVAAEVGLNSLMLQGHGR